MQTTERGTRQIHVGADVHAFAPVCGTQTLDLIDRLDSKLTTSVRRSPA